MYFLRTLMRPLPLVLLNDLHFPSHWLCSVLVEVRALFDFLVEIPGPFNLIARLRSVSAQPQLHPLSLFLLFLGKW